MSEPDILKQLKEAGFRFSGVDKIRLPGGVIGKSSYVAAAATVCLIVVAFSLSDPAYLLVVAILAVVLFVIFFGGALWFAHKHPGESLLEGAELIQWRQMEMAARDLPPSQIGTNPPQQRIGEG